MRTRCYSVILIFICCLFGCKIKKDVVKLNSKTTRIVSKKINLLTGNAKFKIVERTETGKKILVTKGKSCETCTKGNNLIFETIKKFDEKGNLIEKQISKRNKETIIYKYTDGKIMRVDTIKRIVIQLE